MLKNSSHNDAWNKLFFSKEKRGFTLVRLWTPAFTIASDSWAFHILFCFCIALSVNASFFVCFKAYCVDAITAVLYTRFFCPVYELFWGHINLDSFSIFMFLVSYFPWVYTFISWFRRCNGSRKKDQNNVNSDNWNNLKLHFLQGNYKMTVAIYFFRETREKYMKSVQS